MHGLAHSSLVIGLARVVGCNEDTSPMNGTSDVTVLQEGNPRRELLWARNPKRDLTLPFVARTTWREHGQEYSAEVTLKCTHHRGNTEAVLTANVRETLKEVFDVDFEHQQHCLISGVKTQFEWARIGDPTVFQNVGFHTEVIDLRISKDAGRETSGMLLADVGMAASLGFLECWRSRQQCE